MEEVEGGSFQFVVVIFVVHLLLIILIEHPGVDTMVNIIIFVYPQGLQLSLVRSQAKKLLFSGWFQLDSMIGERKNK